jgi:hypothetical protein
MAEIDITVSADLAQNFQLPPCSQIQIPVVKPVSITLPTGATIMGISDLSRGAPTDCSVSFGILMQLMPFLASTECLFKVLALIGPLMKVITGLTKLPPDLSALPDLGTAFENLMPCIEIVTGLGIVVFLKDLLCFIISALKCFLSQMNSLLAILGGLQLRISDATAAGNTDLAATLSCAQADAMAQAGQLTNAIQPIQTVLSLVGTLASFSPIPVNLNVQFPSLGGTVDVPGLTTVLTGVQDLIDALQVVATALGGCGS